jgi:DNA-binding SARP family transcriptional activator
MVPGMEFCLLGPLMVRCDGAAVPVQRGKQRAVLAVLLLNAGQVVRVDELAATLWGSEPPPSAPVTLRNYVKRLRQALGEVGRVRISTQSPGYLIRVNAGELDVSRFEALLEAARSAARVGSWYTAAGQAGAALALWRGEPLADVGSDVLALREVPRLTEMRLQAVETRITADLHLGRHGELVAELQEMAAAHPLRERFHFQLMLALHRCGRRAEALAAYRQARGTLAGELGIEPGPELQRLHQRILAGDQNLTVQSAQPAQSGPSIRLPLFSPAVPRQLPAAARHFAGRASQLQALDEMLGTGSGAGRMAVISAIGGTAGIGKTALALYWAHRVAGRFADGQLHVNLRGFDPSGTPVVPAQVIRDFLDALGVPADRMPASQEAQQGLYRSLLAGRRMLVLLDNARDAEQVRPLLPGNPDCLVLVTSRSDLTGLVAADGARPFLLDVLGHDEALDLLNRRLGASRMAAEPDAADELIELCARLPLALGIVAARAETRPGLTIAGLACDLGSVGGRLDVLDVGDVQSDVRAVFSWSYRLLSDPAARMFRLLGAHAGPDISAPAAASLAGLPLSQARRVLNELTSASVLTEQVPGRFAAHDLLRAWAGELAATSGNEDERQAGMRRVLDHYLHTSARAAALILPGSKPIPLAEPVPGVVPENPENLQAARAWCRAERHVLLTAIAAAGRTGCDTHAWQIPWALSAFFDTQGYWHDWAVSQQSGLAAASRLGDKAAAARAHRSLGAASARLGRYDDARHHDEQALYLYGILGDEIGQARVHSDMSWILELQGRYREAIAHARQALILFQASGQLIGEARALNLLGFSLALSGEPRLGLAYCERALDRCRDLGIPHAEAETWDSVGFAHHCLGDFAQAISCYLRSLDLREDLDDRAGRAATLVHLGDSQHALGNEQAARDAWQEALALGEDFHDPKAGEISAKLELLGSPGP